MNPTGPGPGPGTGTGTGTITKPKLRSVKRKAQIFTDANAFTANNKGVGL